MGECRNRGGREGCGGRGVILWCLCCFSGGIDPTSGCVGRLGHVAFLGGRVKAYGELLVRLIAFSNLPDGGERGL